MTTTAAARRSRQLHPALVLGALLAVALGVPAAALPPPTLASTPETDLTDPFLIAKAAELGHDADAIFAFVRDEIAYEVYAGSLAARAARCGAAPATAPTRRRCWSVCCACRECRRAGCAARWPTRRRSS